MKIEKNNLIIGCDDCENKKQTNFIDFKKSAIVLCDECLQELNRKIVEHLAEKNL